MTRFMSSIQGRNRIVKFNPDGQVAGDLGERGK